MSGPLLERVPPQSLEAEQATLGAMMVEREAITAVADTLSPDDLYWPQHGLLWRVIIDLYREGKPVDLVTVQARLEDRDQLESIGGISYLIELQEAAPTAAAVGDYARIVREKSTLRALIRAGAEIQNLAQRAGDTEIQAIIERASELVDGTRRGASPSDLMSFRYWDFLAAPFPKLERVIEGMARVGEVAGLHGPPGSGKSAAAAAACRSVSTGLSLFGRLACKRGAAIYVEQESALNLFQERMRAFEQGEPTPDDAAELILVPYQGLTFDRPESRTALRRLIEDVRPILLVVDTISACIGKTDMLRPEEVGPWIGFFRGLASDFGLAVFLIGHDVKWAASEPNLRSFFGSVDWAAKVDAAFSFSRLEGRADTFRIAATKTRWTSQAAGLDLAFTIGPGPDGGLVLTGEATPDTLIELAFEAVSDDEDWTRGAEIALRLGRDTDDRSVRDALMSLARRDRLERRQGTGKGRPWEYRRPPSEGGSR